MLFGQGRRQRHLPKFQTLCGRNSLCSCGSTPSATSSLDSGSRSHEGGCHAAIARFENPPRHQETVACLAMGSIPVRVTAGMTSATPWNQQLLQNALASIMRKMVMVCHPHRVGTLSVVHERIQIIWSAICFEAGLLANRSGW